tara:strand:- start:3196 stop:3882 length:687 start_codon:yes stop_codon:yes gene_type:complete
VTALRVSAIIPAAGLGQRFGEKKQFKLLAGRPLLFHTLIPFFHTEKIREIILVLPDNELDKIRRDVISISGGKPVQFVTGGQRRQDSVKNGLQAASANSDFVCIHDAARPFVTKKLICDSINACKNVDGAVIALPSKDTVKFSEDGMVEKTIDREKVWLAQTPQTFNKEKLLKALKNADLLNINGTDESVLMEFMGYSIRLAVGHTNNFKVTTFEDWQRAESLVIQKN